MEKIFFRNLDVDSVRVWVVLVVQKQMVLGRSCPLPLRSRPSMVREHIPDNPSSGVWCQQGVEDRLTYHL
jgi:hypothetical protein